MCHSYLVLKLEFVWATELKLRQENVVFIVFCLPGHAQVHLIFCNLAKCQSVKALHSGTKLWHCYEAAYYLQNCAHVRHAST